MFRILTLLACLLPAHAFAEALTFVAIASGPEAKRAQYDTFLEAVTPIWNRHGMRVVLRVRPSEASHGQFDDIALLEVDSRKQFQAYLADDDYRAIAQDRVEAVDNLVILEGPLTSLPKPQKAGTKMSLVLERTCADDVPGARVALVGRVKGTPPALFDEVGCVRFLTSDDAAIGDVLAGFAVEVID